MLKWYRDELKRDDLPAVQQGDPDLRWRLKVACQVFDHWTFCGAQHAALAERVINGSFSALQDFVQQQKPCPQPQPPADVDRRNANELSYDEFVEQYMRPNRPVIIKGTNEHWAASQDWVSSDGTVNIESLAKHHADAVVWATETNSQAQHYNRRHEMTFGEFAAYWRQRDDDKRLLYLKDWHFASEFPSYKAYTSPPFFTDDWLNDYFDMRHNVADIEPAPSQQDIITSDYRFVYLGPKGSRTPIHADVLRSFSWSSNVAGRKRWCLLPPEHTTLLFDRFGREMAADFGVDTDPDQRFPNLAQAAAHVIEVQQGTNEALFVPSGWHHSVENLEDTLSINHNWINGFNIQWSWQHLQEEHASAARAIEDVRSMTSPTEFDQLVQRNMAANCGLNYWSMSHFMGSIAVRQIQRLRQAPSQSLKCCLADAFSLNRCALVLKGLLSAMSCNGVAQGLGRMQGIDEDYMHRLDCALQILQEGSGSTEQILAAVSDLYTASMATLEAFKHICDDSCLI